MPPVPKEIVFKKVRRFVTNFGEVLMGRWNRIVRANKMYQVMLCYHLF